jgi:hypothetical protein
MFCESWESRIRRLSRAYHEIGGFLRRSVTL